MYRASIVYDPRTIGVLGGSCWRVADCSLISPDRVRVYSDQKIRIRDGKLTMTVTRKLQRGHLCNPRKLLAEFWQHLREHDIIYFGKAA
jgi:hypothetical protein